MTNPSMHLVIRTPASAVYSADVLSLRVPVESGQVGLRPRAEAGVLAVEPGLIIVTLPDHVHLVGTGGGLLRWDGAEAELLTPLAVEGPDAQAVLGELDRALGTPSVEKEARAAFDRLESNILRELREQERATGTRPGEAKATRT